MITNIVFERYTEFDEILLYSVLEYISIGRKWLSFQQ